MIVNKGVEEYQFREWEKLNSITKKISFKNKEQENSNVYAPKVIIYPEEKYFSGIKRIYTPLITY